MAAAMTACRRLTVARSSSLTSNTPWSVATVTPAMQPSPGARMVWISGQKISGMIDALLFLWHERQRAECGRRRLPRDDGGQRPGLAAVSRAREVLQGICQVDEQRLVRIVI